MSAALLLLLACVSFAEGPQTTNWGQGEPGTIHAVFEKVAGGAKREKWAVEAKVVLDERYLPQDAPLVAEEAGGEPVVKVGRAALDAAQSEGEMAFLLAHELHHTLVKKRKRACLRLGLAAVGDEAALRRAPETLRFRLELEREADAWGQRYLADAGYNPLAAVDAIRHVADLGEALGADAAQDSEHDPASERERRLQSYGAGAPFEARCPWPEGGAAAR